MAVLWERKTDGWGARRLDGSLLELLPAPPQSASCAARLIRAEAGGSPVWALIAPANSDVRVNSRAAHAGLCVLSDRDEIRSGAAVRYFSTETLAEVVPFPGAARAVYCARCRQEIQVGAPAVCCPNCGIWYNQSAELPCWTYTEKCTFCGHPTALDAGFSWTPEED